MRWVRREGGDEKDGPGKYINHDEPPSLLLTSSIFAIEVLLIEYDAPPSSLYHTPSYAYAP